MKNIDLIQDLIKQAQNMSYQNGQRDVLEKRAEMLFRKFFGENTHYLKSLKDIRYSPKLKAMITRNNMSEISFNRGKQRLLNLLNVVAEDLELDTTVNEKILTEQETIKNSRNIFIVHGHNEEMKLAVARTIEKLRLNPVILHEQPTKGKTIIEKFTDNSDVAFAIALLSADDIAYKKNDTPESAKYRARQNVIFELGYFIGKVGRERVLALYEAENNLEIPSDYNGVLFVAFDESGRWKLDLIKELKALEINVDANDII